jgi:hypothetical protein
MLFRLDALFPVSSLVERSVYKHTHPYCFPVKKQKQKKKNKTKQNKRNYYIMMITILSRPTELLS